VGVDRLRAVDDRKRKQRLPRMPEQRHVGGDAGHARQVAEPRELAAHVEGVEAAERHGPP
jgi:hypothetical protein